MFQLIIAVAIILLVAMVVYGIEQNILTLCNDCHFMFDNTDKRKELREKYRTYLKSKYPNWNEQDLIYKKE